MVEKSLKFILLIHLANYVLNVDIKTLSLKTSLLGNGLVLNVDLFMIEI